MFHLRVIQLNHIQFFVRPGWVKFKVSDAQKLWTRERSVLSILFRNLRLTWTNGRYRFFENIKTKERSRFALLSQGEDIGVDVQELTESIENMNAKSLNYWLSKFVQEFASTSGGWYPSRTLYSIVCGLKRFLVGRIKSIGCQWQKVSFLLILKDFICSLHFNFV